MRIYSAKPHFEYTDEILEKIKNVLYGGRLILGDYTSEFEKNFSKYIQTKHAIAVSSATAGLEIVLRYWDIKNKEVITPTNTFIACANAVVYAGGKPIFCDIDQETYCMTADDVIEKMTSNTKVVMAVHLAGLPIPDIFEIKKICEENDVFLLEDCSHAHGAMINGMKVGSIGNAGVFSFYPTKIITTCTGGVVTTNDDKLNEFARSYRHHGQGDNLNNIINFGNDWLMDEISAVLGIYQLKELENNIKKRNYLASVYMDLIDDIDHVNYYRHDRNIRHAYYRLLVKISDAMDKNCIIEEMNKSGIEVNTLYPTSLHLQPIYRDMNQKCPRAEYTLKHQIALPIHTELNEDDIVYVIDILTKNF